MEEVSNISNECIRLINYMRNQLNHINCAAILLADAHVGNDLTEKEAAKIVAAIIKMSDLSHIN